MKAKARHVPGSARSCTTRLSRSTTPPRGFEATTENAIEPQLNCSRNHECYFLSYSTSTSYNFNTAKWRHFSRTISVCTLGNQPLNSESSDARRYGLIDRCSFSRRGEGSDEGQTSTFTYPFSSANKPTKTVQNGTLCHFHKNQPLCPNNLRRRPLWASHF